MKRILILGASGRTGKCLLKRALERGYLVTALVRKPEVLGIKHDNLIVIKGSPYYLTDVEDAITGSEAVLVALNNPRKSDMPWAKPIGESDIIARSVANALRVMKENDVKRIVVLSAFGVGDSFQLTPWLTRFFIRMTNLKIVYQDHEATEKLLKASGTDWTTVRPVALSGSSSLKMLDVSYHDKLPLSATISREQVADFMLNILNMHDFFGMTPNISEK